MFILYLGKLDALPSLVGLKDLFFLLILYSIKWIETED